ncbi:hypothetical protein AA0229_0768 [Gluconobacter cerinus NRIC 0229]|nr:hypothetical protein AA0229_0768 [Gluconobacter cerinus NRIC 0229]
MDVQTTVWVVEQQNGWGGYECAGQHCTEGLFWIEVLRRKISQPIQSQKRHHATRTRIGFCKALSLGAQGENDVTARIEVRKQRISGTDQHNAALPSGTGCNICLLHKDAPPHGGRKTCDQIQ